MQSNPKALVLGITPYLINPASVLLYEAGFQIDVVTTSKKIKYLKTPLNIFFVSSIERLVSQAIQNLSNNYDLIIVSDDITLKRIIDSDIPESEKLKLLPICSREHINHICSKIELSKTLRINKINTPDFLVCYSYDHLKSNIQQLDYPTLVKVDYSGGGAGVYECQSQHDIINLKSKLLNYPVLLQKKIEGTPLDLSSFYLNGELVYFSYAEILKNHPNRFGPSVLRKYYPVASLEKEIYDELHKLGKALGANGFVNIGCIKSHIDNKRYYFEADMRPNVWVHYSKYVEQDPAVTIRRYIQNKELLKFNDSKKNEIFEIKVLPYLPRMHWYEVITNRYNCWRFYEIQTKWPYFIQSITDYINLSLSKESLKVLAVKCIKPLTPLPVWQKLKAML